MITLKIKQNDWLTYSENYITNGEFLFHKDYLNNKKSSPDLVQMVLNTNGFIHDNNGYNTNAKLPECKKLIPDINNKDLFILNKTKLLYEKDSKTIARVFTVKDNEGNKFNTYINEKYVKMFEGYNFAKLNTNEYETVLVLDSSYKIIGLIMPIVNIKENVLVA